MDEDTKRYLSLTIVCFIGILLFTGLIVGGVYYYRELNVKNFQITIKDLSEEQKCLHICGFQWDGSYLENYKFCCEKCDRISERLNEN